MHARYEADLALLPIHAMDVDANGKMDLEISIDPPDKIILIYYTFEIGLPQNKY